MTLLELTTTAGSRRKTVRSVERAIAILFLVARSDRPLGLTEIARGSGLDKATALRLLQTLEADQLVWRDARTRNFSPGINVWRLPKSWRHDLRELSRPHLERLRDTTQETTVLVCARGLERVVVEVFAATHELAVVPTVGSAHPIYAGASGKVLMAYLPKGERERVFELTRLKPLTPAGVSDRATFLSILKEVRRTGYAISVGDVNQGACAIAAPVFESTGTVAGVVSVRGPEVRLSMDRMRAMAPLLMEAAGAISWELGHQTAQREAR